MPLDHNLIFKSYDAAQDRRRMGQVDRQLDQRDADSAQDQAYRKATLDIEKQKLAASGMDPEKLFQRGVMKTMLGIPLDPMEEAGMRAQDAIDQRSLATDTYGNVYPSKRSIYDVIGRVGGMGGTPGFNPAAPMPVSGPANAPPRRSPVAQAMGRLDPDLGSSLPAPAPTGRLSMDNLGGGPVDVPELSPAELAAEGPDALPSGRLAITPGNDIPNPNSDRVAASFDGATTPYHQKQLFDKTLDANTDLQKTKAQNQVPGLKTRDGYVPSAEDAKQTKEVSAAVMALDDLVGQYEAALDKTPNPVGGTADALKIQQLQGLIGSQIKSLEMLGAYDAGVERLIKQMLGNPVIGGGSTYDFAMNPVSSAVATYTKSDAARARTANKEAIGQFRAYMREKLKATAGSRGFEPPSTGNASTRPPADMSDDALMKALGL